MKIAAQANKTHVRGILNKEFHLVEKEKKKKKKKLYELCKKERE